MQHLTLQTVLQTLLDKAAVCNSIGADDDADMLRATMHKCAVLSNECLTVDKQANKVFIDEDADVNMQDVVNTITHELDTMLYEEILEELEL